MNCRFCQAPLSEVLIDLGHAPISNAFLDERQLAEPETHFPLKVLVCSACRLAQTADYEKPAALFTDSYVYFSSFSTSWLDHARRYVEAVTARFGLGPASQVVELASNDGYLLQYFHARGIPVLGVEPAANTAAAAQAKGITTVVDFFGMRLAERLAAEGRRADLLLGNNVLAHVPDIGDFVGGMALLLKPDGVITMEFPHLMRLVEHNQFDTIYHEHYSYLSLTAVRRVFESRGLALFDVEELPTHGGSLRIYARHAACARHPATPRLAALLRREQESGLETPDYYRGLQPRALAAKLQLLEFLVAQKRAGRTVAAYGAAAKGNTLLNYCGVTRDLVACVADASPHKQGKYLPGSHIPVVTPGALRALRPDLVLILPWNLQDEITRQLADMRGMGCRFAVPIPGLRVLD